MSEVIPIEIAALLNAELSFSESPKYSILISSLSSGFKILVEKEIKSVTRAGYYPNKKSILIKLVADKKSRRILGAQIVGGEAVKGRIDLLAFALLVRATVDNLANYDACYVPPVSPVWEPINIAASQTAKLFA